MSRLFGFILSVAGGVMLYLGWQAHEAVSVDGVVTVAARFDLQSVWLLTLGAVALAWGLAALVRQRVL